MTTPSLGPDIRRQLSDVEARLFELERRPPLSPLGDPRLDVLWRPPRCSVVKTDAATINTSNDTLVFWSAESYDLEGEGGGETSGMWDVSDRSKVWIPYTDIYSVAASWPWDGSTAGGRYLLSIFRNGSTLVDRDERAGSDGTKTVYPTSKLGGVHVPLTEGDHLTVVVRQETGANQFLLLGAGTPPAYFQVTRAFPSA